MRARTIGRLTPSQESVYRYVGRSSRWLTAEEISTLTGVSIAQTKAALKELHDLNEVLTRKRIGGFENGETEYHRSSSGLPGMCDASRRRFQTDRITGVEPLAKRLRRILGKTKAKEYAEFIE